jgi:hypothetical protein
MRRRNFIQRIGMGTSALVLSKSLHTANYSKGILQENTNPLLKILINTCELVLKSP